MRVGGRHIIALPPTAGITSSVGRTQCVMHASFPSKQGRSGGDSGLLNTYRYV